jgi:agmatinase
LTEIPHRSKPCLIGLPYDASSSFQRGAAQGPDAIRAALFSPAGNGFSEAGIDVNRQALADAGDLELPESGDAMRAAIERGIAAILDAGRRPIALGGDHSITYPILRAFRDRPRDLTVLHIDAHADLYDEFEGDRFSHACPFARALEAGLIGRLVQVGIRTMNPPQWPRVERFGVEQIDMRAWERGARPELTGPVYLSLDLDGLDPAFSPGVSHREPGGLTVREVLTLIQSLPGPLVGADVVELNPRRDLDGVTAAVAAKLVREIAGRMLEEAV